MQRVPTVVAICGSLGDPSTTQGALGHALDAAADAGAETELIDLREWDLPLFDPDHRDRGDAEALRRVVGIPTPSSWARQSITAWCPRR